MYIVTGGAGFIGSRIVKGLNEQGEENILIVDRLRDGDKWKNLVELSYADYMDKEEFLYAVMAGDFDKEGVKGIYHMGACSATTEKDADYLMQNNFAYTRDLAEWAVEMGIRFIYASSAATYGDGRQGYSDTAEIKQLKPLNMYGYSKQLFDLWAQKNGFLDKIAGLKFFNVYGPNEAHKDDMRSVIHKAWGQILKDGKVTLFKSHHPEYKDGEQLRDFVYVKDAVNVAIYLMQHADQNGLFNVGTGEARSFKDLVTATFNAMDKPVNIEYIDMPEYLQPKYQYFTQAEMAKIKKAGYDAAFTSLEDGVKDYVQNHLMLDQ
jgi:ADP-L-glycero-D-manno-heptose 6-epimerase